MVIDPGDLPKEAKQVYNRVADLLGPYGTDVLNELCDLVYDAGYEAGYDECHDEVEEFGDAR
jgi:hypothetical protein